MQKTVTFIKPAYTKTMLQIKVDGEQKPRWCNAAAEIYNWAKQKEKSGEYKEGDIVTIEYEEKGGIWYVTQITKGNESATVNTTPSVAPVTTPPVNTTSPTGVKVCSKCGGSVKYISGNKNGKPWAGYKCNDTNCKNVDWCKTGDKPPVQQQVQPVQQSPEVVSSSSSVATYFADKPEIVSENITTAVSQTLIALQGHVNPSNVDALITSLHAVYLENATKNIKTLKGLA